MYCAGMSIRHLSVLDHSTGFTEGDLVVWPLESAARCSTQIHSSVLSSSIDWSLLSTLSFRCCSWPLAVTFMSSMFLTSNTRTRDVISSSSSTASLRQSGVMTRAVTAGCSLKVQSCFLSFTPHTAITPPDVTKVSTRQSRDST